MRIAYVVNSLEGGGAALPIPKVADLLRGEGAEMRVLALACRDGRARPALEAAGLDVGCAPAGSGPGRLAAAPWLASRLRAFRPDLIWTSLTQATVMGQLAGAAMGLPVVSWQHNAFLKPANLALLRLTRRLTRLWVADSDAVARLTEARFGLAHGAAAVWPLARFEPPLQSPPALRPGGVIRIGSLGRLHPNKGYDVLVEALARLQRETVARPPFEVMVAGEGPERGRLEALASAAGVGVLTFSGYESDPSAFLATCHGYVQPSRAEGLCIAAHEAMLAGLPCVVSAVGELPRTVRPGVEGWVTPPGDAAALASALGAMLAAPDEAARMGERARARVLDRFGAARFDAAGRAVVARVRALARPPL